MKKERLLGTSISSNKITTFALGVFFLEGLTGLFLLFSIPSDRETGILFGFSTGRLAIAAIHAVILLFISYLLFIDRRLKFSLFRKLDSISTSMNDRWIGIAALLLMIVSIIPLQLLLDLYKTTGSYREFAYYQRLLPTLGWFFLIGSQILAFILVKNRSSIARIILENRPAIIPTLVAFMVFLLIVLFSSITGIGLKPDKYGWGAPGVPLMEWQIWTAIFLAFLSAALLGGTFQNKSLLGQKDLLICIGVWIIAVIVWGSQPVPPGYFATPGRLPNFEIYPFSDGAFYDFYAQNIVIGNGYRESQIPPRPLYILFLAIAHFIVGQDYNLVVLVQTFLLAIIPVCVYLLGRTLHSTTAGIAAAIMAILRELTSILSTPFTDDISNSKLLFADLPATLGIVLVMVFVVFWLHKPETRAGVQMAAGLAMGMLLLVRTQSLLLLPVIFLIALVVYRNNLRKFVLDFVLFTLTMVICITPWLIRNYAITGSFIFDHPESQSRVMAQRYDFHGDFDAHERQPGEETGAYSTRLSASIRQTIIDHPVYVAEFIIAHFLNNQIADVMIMPIRWEISSPGELLFPTSPFWQEWKGKISWNEGLLLAVNLMVICLGIGASWKRHKILGLFPLFVNLAYNLSTATARFSGWRYLLPVDWIAYFYYAIGLVALISLLHHRLRPQSDLPGPSEGQKWPAGRTLVFPPKRQVLLFFSIALCLGGSLILAEKIIPARYSSSMNDLVIPHMLENPLVQSFGVDLKALETFETQPNAFIVRGMALYPRFYEAGEGEAKTAKTGYEPSPEARLVFLVAGSPDGLTIMHTGSSPAYFPNGADVSIVGCQHQLFADAFIITVHGDREATIFPGRVDPDV